MSTPALCDKCGVEVMTPDAFDALRQRAEYAESRLASISGVTRQALVERAVLAADNERLSAALRDARQFAEDVREWAKDEHAFEWDDGDESVRDRAAWVALQASAALAGSPVENVCEHGDHPAMAGKRYCSDACQQCDGAEYPKDRECAGICLAGSPVETRVPPNAALMAAFDKVERQQQAALRARVAELERERDNWQEMHHVAVRERDAARAEVERLRALHDLAHAAKAEAEHAANVAREGVERLREALRGLAEESCREHCTGGRVHRNECIEARAALAGRETP